MSSQAGSPDVHGTSTRLRAEIAGPALLAALLGVFLLFGVGFSHIEALHNAAHDTRHAAAFPCH
jgi:cobalt transporter subunit CbtB